MKTLQWSNFRLVANARETRRRFVLEVADTVQHIVLRDALWRVVLSTIIIGAAPQVIDTSPLVPGSYWLQDAGSGAVIGRMVKE